MSLPVAAPPCGIDPVDGVRPETPWWKENEGLMNRCRVRIDYSGPDCRLVRQGLGISQLVPRGKNALTAEEARGVNHPLGPGARRQPKVSHNFINQIGTSRGTN